MLLLYIRVHFVRFAQESLSGLLRNQCLFQSGICTRKHFRVMCAGSDDKLLNFITSQKEAALLRQPQWHYGLTVPASPGHSDRRSV